MANFNMKLYGLLGGSLPWSLGMYFSGAVSEASAESSWSTAVADMFSGGSSMLTLYSGDVTVTQTTTSTLNATMHQTTKTPTGAAFTGSDANASLPWHNAEVVTLRTAMSTKSGHGRVFLPPVAEDQVAAHVLKSTAVTSIVNAFEAMFNAMSTGGLTPFIFNKRTLKDGTAPYTIKNVTAFDVPNKVYQQRRRVSKVVPARTTGTV